MKHQFTLLLFFLFTQQLFAVTDSLPGTGLELGKRGCWLLAPKIKAKNMKNNMGQGIVYFRTNDQPVFKPIGFLGRRIEPYFKGNPAAEDAYTQFVHNGKISILCMAGWVLSTSYAITTLLRRAASIDRKDVTYFPKSGILIGLLGGIGFSIGSSIFKVRSERRLQKAVDIVNGTSPLSHHRTIQTEFCATDHGLGLLFRF